MSRISKLLAHEAFWWLLAGALGLLIPELIAARWMAGNPDFALFAEAAGFFGLGVVMGSLRPERPWRWAVAAVVSAGVKSLAASALPKSSSVIPSYPILFALIGLPHLVLFGLVTLAGASLAAFALTRRHPPSASAAVVPGRDPSLRSRLAASITWILVWSAVLGSTGFAAGFYGPLILRPDSNLGPLLGIFTTGPLGAVVGVALGVILSAVRSWRPPQMVLWIAVSCVLYVAGILVFTASSH
ncbi:MAG TPA: hypothetical protein VF179_09120 [Thermoanaerobaculia bacterium]|nr:hypothetical protein [Thermoanaerobaculia bacterium]